MTSEINFEWDLYSDPKSNEKSDWNLHHDMDNRSYHDVKRIKDLEERLKNTDLSLEEAILEIKVGYDYLRSCGYLAVEECEPEYQMTKSFENFLKKINRL